MSELTIKHYKKEDNPLKDKVIKFMLEYNEEFSNFEYSLTEMSRRWYLDEPENMSDYELIEVFYDINCNDMVAVLNKSNDIIAVRFVIKNQTKDNNSWLDKRVPDEYLPTYFLTFALVDKEYRGKGLWKKMYEYAESNILPTYDGEHSRVGLATSSQNHKMQKAAEKAGLKTINRIKNDRGDADTLIYMKEF